MHGLGRLILPIRNAYALDFESLERLLHVFDRHSGLLKCHIYDPALYAIIADICYNSI